MRTAICLPGLVLVVFVASTASGSVYDVSPRDLLPALIYCCEIAYAAYVVGATVRLLSLDDAGRSWAACAVDVYVSFAIAFAGIFHATTVALPSPARHRAWSGGLAEDHRAAYMQLLLYATTSAAGRFPTVFRPSAWPTLLVAYAQMIVSSSLVAQLPMRMVSTYVKASRAARAARGAPDGG